MFVAKRMWPLLTLAAMAMMLVVNACSGSAQRHATPPTTTTAPPSSALEIVVAELYGAMPVPTMTTLVRTDGCRDEPVTDPVVEEIVADADGNGRADVIRTQSAVPAQMVHEATLQVGFDDGRFSEALVVPTPTLMGVADLDGDGQIEIFGANVGNTGRGGGIVQIHGCALRRVRNETGEPFVYVYWGTGRGCAPSCYPYVECDRRSGGFDLVASDAGWDDNMSGAPPPPLSDDLRYAWQVERWQLRDGLMVRVNFEQGTARHADLPVPQRQGFHCVPT